MTTTVPTLGGEVEVSALGVTLMHEHIFVRTPELQEAFPGFMSWDDDEAIAQARARLTSLVAGGVSTIVDCTVPGLGRDIHRMRRAVEGTGLQVIAATGYYTFDALPFPFHYHGAGRLFPGDGTDPLEQLFVGDIENGIQGTDVRAGILKCTTDTPGVTPDVERLLRAVAGAHLRTGTPITTHAHAGTRRGLEQQQVFAEAGVDLSRVIIGHSNESTDFDYLEQLIDNGSLLGWDRCGLDIDIALDVQLDTLAELCRRGYAGRIVLSHDRHCRSDWFTEQEVSSVVPNWRYDYIDDGVLPGLRNRGVSGEQLDLMRVRNPCDFFAAGR